MSDTPRTKRDWLARAVKELALDTSDPFTLLFANACALLDQRDQLKRELEQAEYIVKDLARELAEAREEIRLRHEADVKASVTHTSQPQSSAKDDAWSPVSHTSVERMILSADCHCPSCGHNRCKSSVSSIDNDDGTFYCQKCSAEWREVP